MNTYKEYEALKEALMKALDIITHEPTSELKCARFNGLMFHAEAYELSGPYVFLYMENEPYMSIDLFEVETITIYWQANGKNHQLTIKKDGGNK